MGGSKRPAVGHAPPPVLFDHAGTIATRRRAPFRASMPAVTRLPPRGGVRQLRARGPGGGRRTRPGGSVGGVTLARFGEVPMVPWSRRTWWCWGTDHGWGITRPASRKRPDAVGYRIGPGRLGASPQAGENLGAAFDTDSPRRGGWTVVPRWAGLGGSGEQPPLGMELMEMVDTSGLQPGRRPRDRAAAGQDGQATPGDPGPR
jgi:hypothetical protein